jgi:hypothetical protein
MPGGARHPDGGTASGALVDEEPTGDRVIAGERADEPVRELAAEGRLEPLTRARAGLGHAGDAGTVLEQTGDGSSFGGWRCGIHDTLVIGRRSPGSDPWRE